LALVQPEVDLTENLALGKPTTQSGKHTQYPRYEASNAVDGNRNSNLGSGSCTKTTEGKGSWWQVDLGAVYVIRKVVITIGKLNN